MASVPEFRPRVVLADDHPSVLVALSRLLRVSCEVVATVSDGRAAIETVVRLRPDVLVCDLTMPEVDGQEVCRRVKQAMPSTLVIIVTAFDDADVANDALHAGASAFIPKHSVPATLEQTIQQLCTARGHVCPPAS